VVDMELSRISPRGQSRNRLPIVLRKTVDKEHERSARKQRFCAAGRIPTAVTGCGANKVLKWRQGTQWPRSLA
jgi:hypothetical protein